MMKKKALALSLVTVLMVSLALSGCGKSESSDGVGEVYVYNWDEYIDDEIIDMLQERADVEVVYDMFGTDEEMYPVVEAGDAAYDTICPFDYMIQKMRENNLLVEINFDNASNISETDLGFIECSEGSDLESKYSVPYCWGTVGILYNISMIAPGDVPIKQFNSWSDEFSGEIPMQDSVRDAFMVTLKSLGYSMNITDEAELQQVRDLLTEQKPLVQAYVIDQVHDKVIGGEAAIGVIYPGEMPYIQEEVENLGLDYKLECVLPEEGTNVRLDSWVIPANAKSKEDAEKWINLLCRSDIVKRNFEYIAYVTPNKGTSELLDGDLQNNKAVLPNVDSLDKFEVFQYLGDDVDATCNDMWKEVKSK